MFLKVEVGQFFASTFMTTRRTSSVLIGSEFPLNLKAQQMQ